MNVRIGGCDVQAVLPNAPRNGTRLCVRLGYCVRAWCVVLSTHCGTRVRAGLWIAAQDEGGHRAREGALALFVAAPSKDHDAAGNLVQQVLPVLGYRPRKGALAACIRTSAHPPGTHCRIGGAVIGQVASLLTPVVRGLLEGVSPSGECTHVGQ